MIEARGPTKFYGDRAAVSDVTFTVRPGVVLIEVLSIEYQSYSFFAPIQASGNP